MTLDSSVSQIVMWFLQACPLLMDDPFLLPWARAKGVACTSSACSTHVQAVGSMSPRTLAAPGSDKPLLLLLI